MSDSEKPTSTLSGSGTVPAPVSSGILIHGIERFDDVLQEDVAYCSWMLDQPNTDEQFWRRTFVRAVFAQIEGKTFLMKRTAHDRPSVQFSPAERSVLTEDDYEVNTLNNKGEVTTRQTRNSTASNIKFAFKSLARARTPTVALNLDGWDALLTGIHIRDRLTHPKQLEDLTVSDDDLDAVKVASDWFNAKFSAHFRISVGRSQGISWHVEAPAISGEGEGTEQDQNNPT